MFGHWGLNSWFGGINEYLVNSYFGCISSPNHDGAFELDNNGKTSFSDCFCCVIPPNNGDNYLSNCNAGTCCLPFAIITHLLCLPIMCSYNSKEEWNKTNYGTRNCVQKNKIETNIISKETNYDGLASTSTHKNYSTTYPQKNYYDEQIKRHYDDQKKYNDDQYKYYQTQMFQNQMYANVTRQLQYNAQMNNDIAMQSARFQQYQNTHKYY